MITISRLEETHLILYITDLYNDESVKNLFIFNFRKYNRVIALLLLLNYKNSYPFKKNILKRSILEGQINEKLPSLFKNNIRKKDQYTIESHN